MLHQTRSRLPDDAVSRIEGFVAYTSPALVVGVHALALLLSGVLGFVQPEIAALLCGVATVSLLAEGSGRFSLLRRVLPKSASYNLVWRHNSDAALGTLIVSAPLDTPRWRPDKPRWLRRPLKAVVVAAMILTVILVLRTLAEPWGRPTQGMYVGSLVVLAAAVALGAVAHRRSGGVREDASGPVALLELVRRFSADPPPGVNVWAVFTGCGHAYQNGMHAFLAMRRGQLVDPVFVLSFDDPGEGQLGAVVSEGPLYAQHHRPTGPAMIERLRWAGLNLPAIDTASITDARAALLWRYRALALAGSGEGKASARATLRAVEVAEAIGRLYADDLQRVPDLHPALRDLLPQPDEADEADDADETDPAPPRDGPPELVALKDLAR